MSATPNFRFLLAATLLLVLFAGAFEAALRWPGRPTPPPVPATIAETSPTPPAPPATRALTPPAPRSAVEADPAAWRVASHPAPQRMRHVHRYGGTIDGRPATAELQWYAPDSVWGRFYRHGREPDYELRGQRNQPDSLVLEVFPNGTSYTPQGRWRVLGRPGEPVLKAVWQQGNRRRRVVLRESYAGAVRYDVRTVEYTDGARGRLVHDFLTLPVPVVVPRRLRDRLSPGPQARLRQLTAARDSLCDAQRRLCVRLNDYGLFSYQLDYHCNPTDASNAGGVGLDSFLFDIVSGQPLTVESQLRPGYERPLRRLLTRHVEPDLVGICFSKYLLLETMPDKGLCLTWSGLEAAYEGPIKCGILSIAIPYRELRPLVRPGTPLARMLTARRI